MIKKVYCYNINIAARLIWYPPYYIPKKKKLDVTACYLTSAFVQSLIFVTSLTDEFSLFHQVQPCFDAIY